MDNRYLLAAVFGGCLLAAAPEGRCAGIYKWVDEQGGTHYTVTPPPPGVPAQEIKAMPGRKAPAQSPAAPAKPAAETGSQPQQIDDKKRAADQKAIRDQVCQELKTNQNTLQTKARVYEKNPQGEITWLTEEQRQQRIADIEKQLKELCQ